MHPALSAHLAASRFYRIVHWCSCKLSGPVPIYLKIGDGLSIDSTCSNCKRVQLRIWSRKRVEADKMTQLQCVSDMSSHLIKSVLSQ